MFVKSTPQFRTKSVHQTPSSNAHVQRIHKEWNALRDSGRAFNDGIPVHSARIKETELRLLAGKPNLFKAISNTCSHAATADEKIYICRLLRELVRATAVTLDRILDELIIPCRLILLW